MQMVGLWGWGWGVERGVRGKISGNLQNAILSGLICALLGQPIKDADGRLACDDSIGERLLPVGRAMESAAPLLRQLRGVLVRLGIAAGKA
jgi:hypothetical protein